MWASKQLKGALCMDPVSKLGEVSFKAEGSRRRNSESPSFDILPATQSVCQALWASHEPQSRLQFSTRTGLLGLILIDGLTAHT